ncbi:glucose-1-phosphate adenylyltransferase [Otariodibacter sp.]|uniref:glucose-1-phosphate adenylyltransferase n=1 Tax=Otariodibacter sp. TaxID=3030919 RepID=UPI002637C3A2|nr:glucose-1-phosphate adenylyltransferase [Otariodibacter sp.]
MLTQETYTDKRNLTSQTLVLILAGGRGSRLYELTDNRAKPAVYFGGSRRIIDFALSNCINSNLLKIGVITQYAAHSLLRHLQRGWSFLPYERNQYIDMLPARQQLDETTWYRGTADAVYQNMAIMKSHYCPKYVIILAGDHIYKMNYNRMLEDHVDSGAKCTVGCIEVPRNQASEFGVMAVNEKLQVKAFVEKPADPPAMPDKPNSSLASMGIYVFNADYLYEMLDKEVTNPNTTHDFGKDIIPKAVEQGVIYAHPFERSSEGRNATGTIYWRDVGTIDSYWAAHMDLVSEKPQLDLYDKSWPIHGRPQQTAPARFFYKKARTSTLDNSLIAGGSVITDAEISNSVLFHEVKVGEDSVVSECVVLPQVIIGKNCTIKRAVIDRHCEIPDGLQIGVNPEEDAKHFRISKGGIVLVCQKMLDKLAK